LSLALALLAGLLSSLAVPAAPAQAAPVVTVIGTAQNGGSAPLVINVGTAVPAGHSIIVIAFEQTTVGNGGSPPAPTCSDPTNGPYTPERSDADGFISRLTVCARHGVSLAAGQQITVTGEGQLTNVAVALDVSGLATNPLDQIQAAHASGTLADSGPLSSPSSQASELLIGAFGAVNNGTFTVGTNGTTANCVDSGTPTYTQDAQPGGGVSTEMLAEHCLVGQVGTYRARADLSTGQRWMAALMAYRASVAAPVATTTGTALSYTEDAGAQAIDSGLTVSAPDSPMLSGATVTISGNFQSSEDSLGFTNQLGISGSYNAGTLTLTGNATPSDYQTALRSVTYMNSSNNPNTATRTIGFKVTDGTANPGNTATRDVTITSVNDAPSGTNKTVTTLEDTAYTVTTADFGFGDGDGNTLAAVKITTLPTAGTLTDNAVAVTAGQFVPVADIAGNKLHFAPAIDGNGAGYASFTFQVQDNGGTANGGVDTDPTPRTLTLDVTAVNDAPEFSIGGDPPAVNEDAGPRTVTGFAAGMRAGPVTATDETGPLTFIVMPSGSTGDLSFSSAPAIDAGTGNLSYTAAANTSGTATFNVTLQDNGSNVTPNVNTSEPQTFTITVNASNDPPIVTTTTGALAYSENQPATAIDPGLTVTDVDSTTLASASVQFTAGYQSAQDVLACPACGGLGIGATFTAGTGSLLLSGATTVASYQTALRSVTYQNTSANPSMAARTVSIQVTDSPGGANSNAATRGITLALVNNPPVAVGDDYAVTAGAVATIPAPGVLANDADPDGPALAAIKVTDPGHGTLTLRPDGGFTYTPADGYAGPDSFTYKANDSQADSNVVTVRLVVGGPTLTIGDVRIEEGNAGTKVASFAVRLNPSSTSPVTVRVRTQDGSATAGTDYVALPPTTLTFAPGETSKTVDVTVNGDTAVESDETFAVVLSNATAASISRASATGSIVNDDSPNPRTQSQVVSSEGTQVPGRLVVTLAAETSICPPGNTLQRIEFGAARNARVEVPGAAPGAPGGPSPTPGGPDGTPGGFTLPVNASTVTFFVQRQAPGDFRVDFAIVDTCNATGVPFRSFVGGGVGVR
jgi:hypothetical protein